MNVAKQNQKSGDHSMQIQINGDYYNIMSPETLRHLIQSFGELAKVEVEARIKQFSDDYLIPRIKQVENGLDAFKDPAFQLLLIEASKKAASSSRLIDYSMLSELMVHRFEKKEDIKTNAVIAKAIETINLIDNDSISALSVIFFIVSHMRPVSGGIHDGLQVIENIFEKILSDTPLPVNNRWLDNLETLQALKVHVKGLMSINSFEVMYKDKLDGYWVCGIKKDSDTYSKYINRMESIALSKNLLVDHELNDGYVRLNIVSTSQIRDNRYIVPGQRDLLMEIFKETQKQHVQKNVDLIFDEYITKNFKYLSIVRDFWNKLPPIELTVLGRLLGYMNIKRLVSEFPEMDVDNI